MFTKFLTGISNFFKALFCFMIDIMIALFVCMPIEQGGLNYPGIIGVLVFLLLLFLFIKVSKVGSSIIGFVGYFLLRIKLVGPDKIIELLGSKEFIFLAALIIGYFILSSCLDRAPHSDSQPEDTKVKPASKYPTLEVTYHGKKHFVEIIQAGLVRTGDIIRGHRDGYDSFKFSRVTVGSRYIDHKDDPVVEILFEDGVWYKISIYDEYQRLIS